MNRDPLWGLSQPFIWSNPLPRVSLDTQALAFQAPSMRGFACRGGRGPAPGHFPDCRTASHGRDLRQAGSGDA